MDTSFLILRKIWDHEPTYSIQRRYPFHRSFKYKLWTSFSLLFALFTVFNIATTGYDLQTSYTTTPNTTLSQKYWFNNGVFTWGDNKLNPKCQNLEIPVGYQFMTSNLGLLYTMRSITFHSAANKTEQRPSISYLNNILTNCQVDDVQVYLRKADSSLPGQSSWWSWMDSTADASASCNITNEEGLFTIAFKVVYNTLPTSFDYVLIDSPTTRASVWWGTRLLNDYFVGILSLMSKKMPDANPNPPTFTQAQMAYYRNEGIKSIEDNGLYSLWYYFLKIGGNIDSVDVLTPDVSGTYNNATFTESRPLTEGLSFARIFQSLILVDLGNTEEPNLLLDEDLIQYTLNGTDDFNRLPGAPLNNGTTAQDWWRYRGIAGPNQPFTITTSIPMDQAYAKFSPQMGPLGTQNASIYSQYMCEIPTRKSIPTVILLVLVSNFVLLQSAWMGFNFVAERYIEVTDPTAMHCAGGVDQCHAPADLEQTKEKGTSSPSIDSSVSNSSSSRFLWRPFRPQEVRVVA